jgi:hypothetical protein
MIRSIRHRGLKRLYEDADPRGVIAQHVVKETLIKLSIFHRC